MGSRDREREQATQHQQPHISSLVVRPSVSDGGDGGRREGGRLAGGGDHEPGEVHRDSSPHSRSDRYKGDLGHRTRAGSRSPARRADRDHGYGSDIDHSSGAPRGHEFGNRRETSGRYRDHSPSGIRGGAGARSNGRGLDGPGLGRGPIRGDGIQRNNNPNVRPREGDWFCPDPLCRNLNFARRESCNNCKRHRYAPVASPPPRPRRDYSLSPPRHFPGPPIDLSPGRGLNGYRSPPHAWPRDSTSRDLLPPPRHDPPAWRDRDREREQLHYLEDDYPRRRPVLDCGRDPLRKPHYERQRPPGHDVRDRSRSPMRGGPPPPPPLRNYRRDSYLERGQGERGGSSRGRLGNGY
ncbi:PREDICTED: uncharacterized protein LOC104820053 [Tarenaya hassleriana]|uniref:uncharacterized protein LOC104820053 n=1 Tax=Tarenaya hassleriana TaxID=28532 RepID=UPI00053C6AA8|nr:PREDICTED: uncharacterized protein LOC104820053 [Tarenaya hassleriana]